MYIDINELKKLFPFEKMRRQQPYVLQEIAKAVNEGYKFILMQLPVGFGKSPVAVDLALAMGKSYIATVNINLQKQYCNDFKFLKRIMGKTNFPCLVKEDQINDGTFSCDPKCYFPSKPNKWQPTILDCNHITANHGLCKTNPVYKGDKCIYRVNQKDYAVTNRGTTDETIYLKPELKKHYDLNNSSSKSTGDLFNSQ